MVKSEIINKMAEFSGGTKTEAERNLEAFCKVLEYAVENKEEFKLIGHFSVEVVPTKARVGRNPATGEEVQIAAGEKVKIKVGKVLKDLVK